VSPVLMALAVALGAQQPPSFPTTVESVYVDVFVTERDQPVLGLTAGDFELRDDGRLQEFNLVSVEARPLLTQLVLDTSGSVAGEKLRQLRSAVRSLLQSMRPGSEVSLLTFNHELRVRVPFTGDVSVVERALDPLEAEGATALHDALFVAAAAAPERGSSLIVLFTDGEDTMSWTDPAELDGVLQRSGVILHAVGIVPGPDPRPRGPNASFRDSEPPEPSHVRRLRRLAEATGGRFWAATRPAGLSAAFAAVQDSLRARYVLRYDLEAEPRPGLHSLQVSLRDRRGSVQHRKHYFVAPRQTPAGPSGPAGPHGADRTPAGR
jgi:VWFA-related protein